MSDSSREAWRRWWDEEGSRMRPLYGEDNEQFTRQMTEIAWANGAFWRRPDIDRLRAELVATKDELASNADELAAMRQQRDEARELYCRQIAYDLFRTTGVFDPQKIAVKRGWEGLFKVSEPVSPKTTAPIHREPAPTPAPPPKKCFKEGNQSC